MGSFYDKPLCIDFQAGRTIITECEEDDSHDTFMEEVVVTPSAKLQGTTPSGEKGRSSATKQRTGQPSLVAEGSKGKKKLSFGKEGESGKTRGKGKLKDAGEKKKSIKVYVVALQIDIMSWVASKSRYNIDISFY